MGGRSLLAGVRCAPRDRPDRLGQADPHRQAREQVVITVEALSLAQINVLMTELQGEYVDGAAPSRFALYGEMMCRRALGAPCTVLEKAEARGWCAGVIAQRL